jgi:putative ABC transport system permease protein
VRWGLRVSLHDLVHQAATALLAHRLRSTLSAIGIVFGIATVVTALAIGEGARSAALSEIGALGIDNVFLRAVGAPQAPGSRQQPSAPVLSLDDARVIEDTLENARAVAAMRVAQTEIVAGSKHTDGLLAGVTVSWRDVIQLQMSAGRWLTADDERAQRRVAVLGGGLARTLFGSENPSGSRVKAGGTWYYVVGLLEDRSQGEASPAIAHLDLDQSLLVPLRTMDIGLGRGDAPTRVQEIAVRLDGPAEVELASRVIGAIADRRHRAEPPAYEVVVPRELLRARLRAQRTFNVVLFGIGALALLISGIGIMNIMLASVAERTQEIGMRRAFGARRGEVIAQFAIEAALLCMIGGTAGVLLGGALSGIVALAAGWPVSVSLRDVAVALALATSVGLAFGIYPAGVAASIDPIDALRAP